MPLLSREVLTLRLILDCDDDADGEYTTLQESKLPTHLLRLPVELRLAILRYLLCIDCNRKAYTRRPPQNSISELLYLNPRRILEAAPFKHRGTQDINGSPPILKSCHLQPAILRTCRQLYHEGRTVFYNDNRVLAIQSNIKGLGSKLKNYGVPVLGPFPATHLISGPCDDKQPSPFRFAPLMLFAGGNTKPNSPFYVCSHLDAADFMHALWIMVKSPFARGMNYNVTLSENMHSRHLRRTDSFFRAAVLPWLHDHINSINSDQTAPGSTEGKATTGTADRSKSRLTSLRDEFDKHITANKKETNLHLYKSICDYLERILLQGEICVDQGNFITAELTFERVCYEACSLVRTRTSALVDVSSRSRDGINRICKLIAVSAFRLCELRGGSLSNLIWNREQARLRQETEAQAAKELAAGAPASTVVEENLQKAESQEGSVESTVECCSEDDAPATPGHSARRSISDASAKSEPRSATIDEPAVQSAPQTTPPKFGLTRTTRLDTQAARELALVSGLLALRLPCASPVPEWNIRLDIMLLRLFAWRGDTANANWSVRRIHNNGTIVMAGVKAKNKASEQKWVAFTELMEHLSQQLRREAPKIFCFLETADKIEDVVKVVWGERLMPKKGYNGLIWTFRWAG